MAPRRRSACQTCRLPTLDGSGLRAISYKRKAPSMSLGTILLIILILMLLGAFPRWGYNRNWGYGPSGGLGLVVVIILILVLLGRI